MKARPILKPRAQSDIDEIWDYTSERCGPDQAEIYTRQLWADMPKVADNPSLSRECDEVRTGYRKYRSGSHILFFRISERGVEVVRVLHERMDYDRQIP